MSGRGSLVASGIAVGIGSILPMVSGGLLWITVSRIIGSHGVGIASAVISASFLASYISSLGMDMAIVKNIRRIGAEALFTGIGVASSISIVAGIVASVMISGRLPQGYPALIPVFSVLFTISFLLQWSLVGLSRNLDYVKVSATASLVKLVLGVGLAMYYGPLGVVAGFIAGSVAAILLSMPIVLSSVHAGGQGIVSIRVVLDGLSNYPNMLASTLAPNLGTLLALLVSQNIGDVGVFYLSLTAAIMAGSFSYSIAYVAASRSRMDVYQYAVRYSLLFAAVAASALAAAPRLVYFVLGISGDPFILRILALSVVGYASVYMVVSMLNTMGDRLRLAIVGITRLLFMVILAVLLSGHGVMGVALAYTLSLYIAMTVGGIWGIMDTSVKALLGMVAGSLAGSLAAPISQILSMTVATLVSVGVLVAVGLVSINDIMRIIRLVALAGRRS